MKILKVETYREFVCEVAKAIETGKDKDVVFIENFPFGVQKKHEFINGDVMFISAILLKNGSKNQTTMY